MSDNELVGVFTVVGSLIFGLVAGIATIVRAKARNEFEHKIVLEKLENILKHNADILDHLEDVLKHPGETEFSVTSLGEELLEEIADIKALIKELK